jgi:hypothetical protein
MKLRESFSGSYLLILIGFLLIFLPILTHKDTGALTGFSVVFIALAYMSAKYRRVNVLMLTAFRGGYEFLMVVTSFFIALMTTLKIDSLLSIEFIPLFLWLMVLISYIAVNIGNRKNDTITYRPKDEKGEGVIDVGSTEFFGSSAAIVLGVLYFLSGVNVVAQKTDGSTNGLVFGLVVILGALAYKSAKKRKLGLKNSSLFRISLEIIAIILILASVLMANTDIKIFIAEDLVPFLIWVWSLTAYLYIVASNYIKKQSD